MIDYASLAGAAAILGTFVPLSSYVGKGAPGNELGVTLVLYSLLAFLLFVTSIVLALLGLWVSLVPFVAGCTAVSVVLAVRVFR